jgi:hypothetical protein
MFKDVYGYLAQGDLTAKPSFPTFRDGLRGLILGESVVESSRSGAWTKVQ